MVKIFCVVRDGYVEEALRYLKKLAQREGTHREMRRRAHYEKPSDERVRRSKEAVRRQRKLSRRWSQDKH